MQGGVDCNAAGMMSHAMQQAMANAAAAGGMSMAHHEHDEMHGDMDEAWAHDYVMNMHQHAHQHHQHHHMHMDPMAEDWAHQFHAPEAAQGSMTGPVVHDDELTAALENAHAEAEMEGAYAEGEFAEGEAAGAADDWLEQFKEQQHEGDEWAEEYNDENVKVYGPNGEPAQPVEEKDANSEFHGLMRDIQSGNVVIEEGGNLAADGPAAAEVDEDFAAEYIADPEEEAMRRAWAKAAEDETGEDFINEMMARERALGGGPQAAQAAGVETWEEEFAAQEQDDFADEYFGEGDEWLKEYENLTRRANDAQNSTDYPFETNNPYLFHDDPFTEGQELLAAGTLSEAVLAFEAACQKDPKNVEYWQFLGTTQAENEKDALAIIALNNAVRLCPTNLHALGALAVSHTNESNHTLAMKTLRDWITVNEKYDGIAQLVSDAPADPESVEDHYVAEYLFVDPVQHKQVTSMYEAALEMNPSDSELHKLLGVLHNLSNQYDRAAENFRNALKIAPSDEKLWNKLGATLANGNRPREAIDAYNRALDINPGFVRAHYNLGISYSNCGDHVQAARQFIRAIVMQQGGTAPPEDESSPPRSTREIWDVLRMTLNLMEKPELVEQTWRHDIRPFVSEFGLHDIDF